MILKTQIISSIFLSWLILASATPAHAEEQKPKSMAVAAILALDPIPADGLAYAGKDGLAAANSVFGLIGMLSFWYGISLAARGNNEYAGYPVFFGGLLYFPALIWDGIGGIHYTKKYNASIAHKQSLLQRITPLVAVTDRGANVGAQVQF